MMSTDSGASAMTAARRWLGLVADLVIVVLVVAVTKTAIAEPFYIPSASMEPTLQIGDGIIATKFPYGYSLASLPDPFALRPSGRIFSSLPSRGDVVVFRWPGNLHEIWVKRIVGLPGDRIEVHRGQLWINGKPAGLRPAGTGLIERDNGTRMAAPRFIETLPDGRSHPIFLTSPDSPLENTAPVVVPPHHVFVMGDNRDDSADSRVPLVDGGVGMLPVANLVGQVDAIVASWDFAAADRGPVWTWPERLRPSRFFMAVR